MSYFFSAATRPAGVIVIDSSDDENDDIPDATATPNIEANRDDVELTNNEANVNVSDDPVGNANCQQSSGPACDGSEVENIALDQVPSCSTDNVPHETETAEQNGAAEVASAPNEETNALSDSNANNDNENTPSTSSNEAEMAPPIEVEMENQVSFGPVPMKKSRLCPFVSRFRSNLKMHMQGHTGQKKPYKCHICPKYFASPEEVEKHLKFNRHRFRFYCTSCARGFPFANNIITHEKKCKKSRVYECYVCHFTMHRLSTLELHMRKHSGHKPYKCTECSERYAYLKDLTEHSTVHAAQNVIQRSDDEN